MRKPTFVSLLVWINGGVPAALLLNDAWHHQLGANPVNFAILTTGLLALIFLTLSLAITPLRQITRWEAPYPARRTLGLWAALYAFAHVFIFFWWDRERSIQSTIHEILTRNYLWFGSLAVLIFIPLTLTSTRGWIRRLGRGWKWLHRLVYLAAIGAAVHYMLQGKFVSVQSIVFASILGALLFYRLVASSIRLTKHFYRLTQPAGRGFDVALKRPKFWKGQLKVIATFDETPEVRTFRLAPIDGGPLPFDYKAGQYLNLMLSVDGKSVNRSYTIASSPTRAGSCEVTVKREEMGASSGHLHKTIKVGDTLTIGAPAGKFTFDDTKHDSIVLIAGGVGITPLMSKVRYLTDVGYPGEIFFILSARAERDIIFRDELALLTKRHPNLHVTITLSRAADDWKGERGRVSAELLRRVVPDLNKRIVHLCGPTEMTDATTKLLIDLGVPATQIESESFTPAGRMVGETPAAADPAAESDGQPHTITFATSGQSVEAPADQTILEAAENAGVTIDFDCRSGICGTCKIKCVGGDVAMEVQDALSASDKAAGLILACQARCLNDVTVEA